MSADIYRDGTLSRSSGRSEEGWASAWLLRILLIGSLFVLGVELRELVDARRDAANAPVVSVPTVVTAKPRQAAPATAVPHVTTTRPAPSDPLAGRNVTDLRRPMVFSLETDGVLRATGTIDAGTVERLEQALAQHGSAVRTLALDSPGGSLDDAIAMAQLVRTRGLDTRVTGGAICASSCPLVLAGGVGRSVDAGGAIGVHQFYASTDLEEDPKQAMVDAQLMTARIAKHLEEMGVDPALWFNALSTPPQSLYFLTREEMRRYRLLTAPVSAASDGVSERS